MRLFCFHYAGGSASVFRPWVKDLIAPVEIIGIQMPGRETRFTEMPFYDLRHVIEDLITHFPVYFDKPFIFFGHSVGARISFELTRALRKKGYPLPQHLIVSGANPPHLPLRRKRIHHLPDSEFISELSSYNGIPMILMENKELLSLFTPTLKADFSISETYAYLEEAALSCPISVFGGIEDPYVATEDLSGWQSQTCIEFEKYLFKGDHFFLTKESYLETTKAVDQIILSEIERTCLETKNAV